MSQPRQARLRALAKINLDLRVLAKRRDQYHELRTIFQTISLADAIDVSFTPSRRTSIQLHSNLDIPGNLVVRAAELALERLRVAGRLEFRLEKNIPLAAGLGGGSSDAAAVLLALPVLAGRRIELAQLLELAAELGSDVPFFLLGGTAVGIGRGTELYPLPDAPSRPGLLVAPRAPVSTAAAYRDLAAQLTIESQQNKIVSFQSQVWRVVANRAASGGPADGANDFESVVFEQFPELASLRRRLSKLGARPARLTGSGSALFGLFRTGEEVTRASQSLREEHVYPISLVSRARYRRLWWRLLRAHMNENLWPPQSRYVR